MPANRHLDREMGRRPCPRSGPTTIARAVATSSLKHFLTAHRVSWHQEVRILFTGSHTSGMGDPLGGLQEVGGTSPCCIMIHE